MSQIKYANVPKVTQFSDLFFSSQTPTEQICKKSAYLSPLLTASCSFRRKLKHPVFSFLLKLAGMTEESKLCGSKSSTWTIRRWWLTGGQGGSWTPALITQLLRLRLQPDGPRNPRRPRVTDMHHKLWDFFFYTDWIYEGICSCSGCFNHQPSNYCLCFLMLPNCWCLDVYISLRGQITFQPIPNCHYGLQVKKNY